MIDLSKMFKKILLTIFLGLLFSLCFQVGTVLFQNFSFKVSAEQFSVGFSAFFGAFFAFLFLQLASILKRIEKRKSKHYNAAVQFEHICGEYINIFSDNILVIDNFTKQFENISATSVPVIFPNKLREIPINRELLLDLNNISLINEIFSLNSALTKINDDIDSFNRTYHEDLKRTLINNPASKKNYVENVKIIAKNLIQLRELFLNPLAKNTLRILAIIRSLTKRKGFLIYLTSRPHYLTEQNLQESQKYFSDIKNTLKNDYFKNLTW